MSSSSSDDNISYVYMLYSDNSNNCYIGSTSSKVKRRFQVHKACYKRWKAGMDHKKFSCFELFDEVGIENIKYKIIKTVNDCCRCQIRDYEKDAIINCELNPINKNIPNQTTKEYYQRNKEKYHQYYLNKKDKYRQMYLDNKEERNRKSKERYHQKKKEMEELKQKLESIENNKKESL